MHASDNIKYLSVTVMNSLNCNDLRKKKVSLLEVYMEPEIKTLLIRILAYFLFTIATIFLFVQVENTGKDDVIQKYQLLRSLYESMASKYNITIEDFNNFSKAAYGALSDPKPQWTYLAAADFVCQALTTIGYGNITPQTSEGQLLCIAASFIGIPITLLALKSIGELIVKWVNTIVTRFERRVLRRPESKHLQTKSAVILFLFMFLLMIGCGQFWVYYKGWSFAEGVYFWFITFSTIGFGDFVPVVHGPHSRKQLILNNSTNNIKEFESEDQGNDILQVVEYLFLELLALFALCVVSSVLNSIVAAVEELKHYSNCHCRPPRRIQEHSDNNTNEIPSKQNGENTNLSMENFGFQNREYVSSVTETK